METNSFLNRLLSGTRRDIVLLLRPQQRTVRELAETLDLTRNAIRSQLSKLERDGFVHIVDRRPTARKPEYVYGLTDSAEQLFPKSYDLILNTLLSVLSETHQAEETAQLLREVGRRLARLHKPHQLEDAPSDRLERAKRVLCDLGGLPEVREDGDTYRLEGVSCPLASVVDAHGSQGCDLACALLEELTELPIERRCQLDDERPKCQFVVQQSSCEEN